MAFTGLIMTNEGRYALTRAQLGEDLKFLYIAIGDGKYSGSYNDIRELANRLFTIQIGKMEIEADNCILEADITNIGTEQGYYLRELGIYAESRGKEILYAYTNAGNDAEYIPIGGAAATVEKRLRFTLAVSGTENITIAGSSVLYVSQHEFEEYQSSILAITEQEIDALDSILPEEPEEVTGEPITTEDIDKIIK